MLSIFPSCSLCFSSTTSAILWCKFWNWKSLVSFNCAIESAALYKTSLEVPSSLFPVHTCNSRSWYCESYHHHYAYYSSTQSKHFLSIKTTPSLFCVRSSQKSRMSTTSPMHPQRAYIIQHVYVFC